MDVDYEGYNSVVCDAEESDWLDISYTQRKYIDKPATRFHLPKFHLPKINLKFKKAWTYVAIAVVCVAVLAGLLFVDGNFTSDVFNAVRTANTSVFTRPQYIAENKVNIPCNLTLLEINDGVMTFTGGSVAVSMTQGTVKEIGDDFVTIAMDNDTEIVYNNLSSVLVSAGSKVGANAVLGKYHGTFTGAIYDSGKLVTGVVGSGSELKWSV